MQEKEDLEEFLEWKRSRPRSSSHSNSSRCRAIVPVEEDESDDEFEEKKKALEKSLKLKGVSSAARAGVD